MIILYDKTESSFKSLGLGVLNDTISCVVIEQLNGSFELEMEYPLSGQHYKSIELENFIFVKPNMYDNEQAFRIYSISKPFNGIVTINAEHISYDMNGYTIPPFVAENLQEALDIISDTSVVPNQFKFYTDKVVNSKMISPTPSSMRGLIAGREGSLLDLYKGEFIFDMYDVRLVNKRGEDRGVSIKYGKNMLDIEQDTTSEKLFTGIFPFYRTTKNETVVERIMIYEEVYIVHGSNPRYSDWLSKYPSDDFLNGGDPLVPIGNNTPVQIKTPGDYLDAIFWYEKATLTKGTLVLANTRDNPEYSINWLSNFETGVNIQPQEYVIYNIRTEGDFEGMKVVWNQSKGKYEEYSGEGFYYIPNVIPPPNFPKEVRADDNQIEVYKDLRSIVDNPNIVNGVLYVEGKKDSPHQKILTLDITDKFAEEPTLEHLLAKAEDYIANNKLDEIKEEIKVSFIKLSDSTEYEHYKDLEKVKLGDTIHISYERLNIETTKTVIETEYNVLTNTYNEIELGTKKSSLGDTVMIAGSNISELTNDANYTDKIVVGRLLAQYITADLIESKVANFVEAAIESLTVRKMDVTGLIEASAAAINSLVAQSLTAENAEIKEALEAGQVNVKGKITALSGVIGGCYIEDGKLHITTQISIGKDEHQNVVFRVDENGHLFAKSAEIEGKVNITEGEIKIGQNFKVTNDGKMTAKEATIEGDVNIKSGAIKIGQDFEVSNDGKMTSKEATIEGDVNIKSGSIKIGQDFEVSNDGKMTSKEATIEGDVNIKSGSIKIGQDFEVSNDGKLKASEADIDGTININDGSIRLNDGMFLVDNAGNVIARSFQLIESKVNIEDGVLKAEDADITGTFNTIDMHVRDNITFNEENVKLGYVKINDRITHYRSVKFGEYGNPLMGYGQISQIIEISDIQNSAYFPNKTNASHTVNVYFSYTIRYDSGLVEDAMDVVKVTFASGSAYRARQTATIYPNYGLYANVRISLSPSSVSEWVTTGSDNHALGVDADFAPKANGVFALGNPNYKWDTIYTSSESINTSDRNQKNNIIYDNDTYDELFDLLRVASFKYNDGQSGRTHLGLIAQDVKESMDILGIDSKDFAAYIKSKKQHAIFMEEEELTDDDYVYGLRYSEFIPMLIKQVQLLKKEVKELKEK